MSRPSFPEGEKVRRQRRGRGFYKGSKTLVHEIEEGKEMVIARHDKTRAGAQAEGVMTLWDEGYGFDGY